MRLRTAISGLLLIHPGTLELTDRIILLRCSRCRLLLLQLQLFGCVVFFDAIDFVEEATVWAFAILILHVVLEALLTDLIKKTDNRLRIE